MKGGLGNLMKQAQLVQENMKKLQEQLAITEFEGQAGSGKVKIILTGRHEAKRVTIDPGLLAGDREMLEDLITVAINDAARRVATMTQEKMAGAAAGLPLPPGLKLPF
jgi:DNA-binding YbaB/EbfC family protein